MSRAVNKAEYHVGLRESFRRAVDKAENYVGPTLGVRVVDESR